MLFCLRNLGIYMRRSTALCSGYTIIIDARGLETVILVKILQAFEVNTLFSTCLSKFTSCQPFWDLKHKALQVVIQFVLTLTGLRIFLAILFGRLPSSSIHFLVYVWNAYPLMHYIITANQPSMTRIHWCRPFKTTDAYPMLSFCFR